MKTATILAAGLALVAGIGMAGPLAGHKSTTKYPIKCPVTKLPIASLAVAVARSVYHGKTYYFCTSNCKSLFDRNPKKYVKK